MAHYLLLASPLAIGVFLELELHSVDMDMWPCYSGRRSSVQTWRRELQVATSMMQPLGSGKTETDDREQKVPFGSSLKGFLLFSRA